MCVVMVEVAGGCWEQTLSGSGAAEPVLLAMRMRRAVPALECVCAPQPGSL